MFNIQQVAKELDDLLHDIVVKQGMFVSVSKGLIRYKNYIIVRNNEGDWVVAVLVNDRKKYISTVCLKVSAFAICKLHEKNKKIKIAEIEEQDSIFKKNYINSQFYKKTAQSSTNEITKDNAVWRYEIAANDARVAKKKIDSIFYASLA
jgi:hypothetical protein